MKNILLFLVLFSTTSQTFAQSGFETIRKAERSYEVGLKKRALRLLSEAERMNYGFCGNSWMSAERSINLLRAKIYIEFKEYPLARNSLNAIGTTYKGDNLDSIVIRTYQLEFGKDFLSRMIDSSLVNAKLQCRTYPCFVIIPLTDERTLKLKVNLMPNLNLADLDDEKERIEVWVSKFRESKSYKLIKEKAEN